MEDHEGGDHRRERHEGEEAVRQFGALGGRELDRLPDDGVCRRADGRLLGAPSGVRDERGDGLNYDRPVALEPELAQLGDHHACVLARDVAENEYRHQAVLGGAVRGGRDLALRDGREGRGALTRRVPGRADDTETWDDATDRKSPRG